MKSIIAATLIAGALLAGGHPALAKAVRLTDTQLDRVTAGGSVIVLANGSVGRGFVIDATAAGGTTGILLGYGVSLSFGSNERANVTINGNATVFSKIMSGRTGPIGFTIGVVAAH